MDRNDVSLLQQVRQEVGAHKAFMITNFGFTSGAVAAAKHHGIALHILQPVFDASTLPKGDRTAIQARLHDLSSAGRIYSFRVELRGLETSTTTTQVPSPVADPPVGSRSAPYDTRVL